MKNLIFALVMCLILPLQAVAVPDLEATMKNMGFKFKKAREATTVIEVQPYLQELTNLTELAATAHFPEEKAVVYREGLDKVLVELQAAEIAAVNDDMPLVQQHLQQIDNLRKQYHKERRSSIWKLLFGRS